MISGVDTTLVRWALAVALLGAGAVLLAVFLRVVRPAMKAGGPPDGRAALRRMALLPDWPARPPGWPSRSAHS